MEFKVDLNQKVVRAIREGKLSSREISRALADYVAQNKQPTHSIGIDPNPADSGSYKTQDQWIAFFNNQKRPMISAEDVYRAGQTGSDNLITSLRDDFERIWLVTSTRNIYQPASLDGRISQNHGSTVVKPKERRVLIPVYQGIQLPKVLETPEGLAYFRAQVNTEDDPKKIAQTLERLSGKSPDSTYVYTPDQESRKQRPDRAVWFDYVGGRFHVSGSYWIVNDDGRSRGGASLVKPAKQARKK